MTADLAPPRGTQDLLPDRADAMLGLYDDAHRLARAFGFRYLETPTFEHTELFTRTAGETSDVVTKEMYTFEDKGGRSVTLRPESTAGVMRAWLARAQALGSPFRGYYLASEFRHGRPQAGRMREFRQFGVEIIGAAAPGADVEVIASGERYLRERGLRRYRLHLNSIGDDACRPAYRDELVTYFEGFEDRLDDDCRASDSGRTRCASSTARSTARRTSCSPPPRSPTGCADRARNTSRAFGAAWTPPASTTCSIRDSCAASTTTRGRRSNGSPRSWRRARPARSTPGDATTASPRRWGVSPRRGSGSRMGLDRVLLAMEGEGVALPPARVPRAFVVAVGTDAAASGSRLLADLRTAGVPAIAALEDRPMKAQMKQADRARATFAAIVGEQELADGTVTLRRLADGIQKTVPAADASGWLLRLDDWTEIVMATPSAADGDAMRTAMRTLDVRIPAIRARGHDRHPVRVGRRTAATTAASPSSICATGRAFVQVVFHPENAPEAHAAAQELRGEWRRPHHGHGPRTSRRDGEPGSRRPARSKSSHPNSKCSVARRRRRSRSRTAAKRR